MKKKRRRQNDELRERRKQRRAKEGGKERDEETGGVKGSNIGWLSGNHHLHKIVAVALKGAFARPPCPRGAP